MISWFGSILLLELPRRRLLASLNAPKRRAGVALRTALSLPLLFALSITLHGCARLSGEKRQTYATVPNEPNDDAERAKKLNTEALAKLDSGKLDAAEVLLREALAADVDYGPAHNNLGQIYLRRRQLYLAAWEFQFASSLMPDRTECLVNLGLVYEAANRLMDARNVYEDAMQVAPDDVEALANLARVCVKLDDDPGRIHFLLNEIVIRDDRPAWRKWAMDLLATKYQYAGIPQGSVDPGLSQQLSPYDVRSGAPPGSFDNSLPSPSGLPQQPIETIPPPVSLPVLPGDASVLRASPLELSQSPQTPPGAAAGLAHPSAPAWVSVPSAAVRTVDLIVPPGIPNLPSAQIGHDVQPVGFQSPVLNSTLPAPPIEQPRP